MQGSSLVSLSPVGSLAPGGSVGVIGSSSSSSASAGGSLSLSIRPPSQQKQSSSTSEYGTEVTGMGLRPIEMKSFLLRSVKVTVLL